MTNPHRNKIVSILGAFLLVGLITAALSPIRVVISKHNNSIEISVYGKTSHNGYSLGLNLKEVGIELWPVGGTVHGGFADGPTIWKWPKSDESRVSSAV